MTLQNSALYSMTCEICPNFKTTTSSLISLKLFIGLLPVYGEKKRHYHFFFFQKLDLLTEQ